MKALATLESNTQPWNRKGLEWKLQNYLRSSSKVDVVCIKTYFTE